VAEGVERARQDRPERPEQGNIARLKMKNLETFDGKSSTACNQWWEAVTMYLGFYPETMDRQKIAWTGTLLMNTALAWHLPRYRELQDNDTWTNYVAAIRAEYHNEREVADAQLKLGQLKYQGSIRTYMTEFRALNNFARATGEGLKEKIDLAMPDSILDMRFNQNPEDLVEDEQFLHATYRAGIQVEKKKALKGARELVKGTQPRKDDRQKDGQVKGSSDNTRRGKENAKESDPRRDGATERKSQYGGQGSWASKDAALAGVPAKEQEEYGRVWEDCWRCGRSSHKTYECFSFNTRKGTALPPAPWKAAAVAQGKRKRSEEPEEAMLANKQQKVAAVETMDADTMRPLWEDSELDFKGQGPAATLGPCNNMWSVPKTKKRGTKRRNPEETEKDALQRHTSSNRNDDTSGQYKAPSESTTRHRMFNSFNKRTNNEPTWLGAKETSTRPQYRELHRRGGQRSGPILYKAHAPPAPKTLLHREVRSLAYGPRN